ncbi:reverse transcriptase-like protein [Gossypium australe]|uniref:Reverse transcriptase-like protein n=1 Tax=Gossypium australe TaxID=47621 RepID=A0A5B6VPR9_9ROSI|nr:reverse transcriptase-like protein [Gossypium australe]
MALLAKIWGARRLLEEGVGWRIGDGTAVNIWNDAWLPRPGRNGRVHYQIINIRYSKVSDVTKRESVTWKQDAICLLFGEEQLKRILMIPLVSSEPHDALI